jgi:hypothetical protein
MNVQSEKPGLLRANQDACTMLLGTLMLHVVSSLRKHRQELEVMVDPEAEYTGDAAATFISAAVDVITVLPPNQSTCGFWESLLALGASSLNRTCASQTFSCTLLSVHPLASCCMSSQACGNIGRSSR